MKNLGKFEHDDDVVTKKDIECVITLPFGSGVTSDPIVSLNFEADPTGETLLIRLFGSFVNRDDRGFAEYYAYLGSNSKVREVLKTGSETFEKWSRLGGIKVEGNEVKIHISKSSTSPLTATFKNLNPNGSKIISSNIMK